MPVKEIVTPVLVEGSMWCAKNYVSVSLYVDIPATINIRAPLLVRLVINLVCLAAAILENVDAVEGVEKNVSNVENPAFGAVTNIVKMGTIAQTSVLKNVIDPHVIEDVIKIYPVNIVALVYVENHVPPCVEDATKIN